MIKVSTAELKTRLSHYLGLVREGTEVYVTSHRQTVAQLSASGAADEVRMVPPSRPMADLRQQDAVKLSKPVDGVRALLEDRGRR